MRLRPLESACLARGVEPPPLEDKWRFHRGGRVPERNGVLWKGSSWTLAVSAHLNPDACLRWGLRKRLEPAASGGSWGQYCAINTLRVSLGHSFQILSAVFLKYYNPGIETNLCLSVCRFYLSRSVTLRRLSLKSHVISRNAFALFEVVKVSSLPLEADTISVCEAVSDLYQWLTSPSVISRLQPERKILLAWITRELCFKTDILWRLII